jgi:hypothetical protein
MATLAAAGCGVPGEAISAGQTTTSITTSSAAPVIEQDTSKARDPSRPAPEEPAALVPWMAGRAVKVATPRSIT